MFKQDLQYGAETSFKCIDYFLANVKIVDFGVHDQRPNNKVDWQSLSSVESGGPLSDGKVNT